MSINNIQYTQLPENMQYIADIIGLHATRKLVVVWGGMDKLWIPLATNIHADHPLAKQLGIDNAKKLSNVFGGNYIAVALCTQALREQIKQQVNDLTDQDKTNAQIAKQLGCCERSVRRIRNRKTKPQKQQSLF